MHGSTIITKGGTKFRRERVNEYVRTGQNENVCGQDREPEGERAKEAEVERGQGIACGAEKTWKGTHEKWSEFLEA